MLSKQPNQAPARRGFGLVVALCVGVLIGALGTAMLFPQSTKETESPTPAPRPILAAITLSPTNDDDVIPHNNPERRRMEFDAQSECEAALLKYLEGSDLLRKLNCHFQ